MVQATIQQARKVPSADSARAGKFDMFIFYSADPGGPGMVKVPAEAATEDAIKLAIKADMTQRAALEGKTLTL
jgi:hypothetical protein